MTLVEVIVAAVIISIVSLTVFSVFSVIINSEKRDLDNRTDAESVESQIATGKDPASRADIALTLPGGFDLEASADTYVDGRSSYTLIEGSKAPEMPQYSLGDGADLIGGRNTGPVGGSIAYVVPSDGYYHLEAWGADGGAGYSEIDDPGGKGGYAAGVVWLDKGVTLYLYVGGAGTTGNGAKGGYNGGGNASTYAGEGTGGRSIGSGGGGTDISVLVNDNNNRILSAGGGGGGANYVTNPQHTYTERGGNGGGVTGGDGKTYTDRNGKGATQTRGGAGAPSATDPNGTTGAGRFYGGGHGPTKNSPNYPKGASGGGGGGGWFGGGAGAWAGGGGGSGYVLTRHSYKPPGYFPEHPRFWFEESTVVNVSIDQAGYVPHPGGSTARGGLVCITYLGWELP
jgi:type II secretory pathway pseudopilin PulG